MNRLTSVPQRPSTVRYRSGAGWLPVQGLGLVHPVPGRGSPGPIRLPLAPQIGGLGAIEELWRGVGRRVAQALEAKDPYTREHSERVGLYAAAMAREFGLDAGEVAEARLGGELHDVGKIGVPDQLLCKPCPLTFDEYRCVMEHTLVGEQILLPLLRHHPTVLGVVRWHHESFDGSGSPDGLRGGEIPLAVRIVTVADCFDAMTTARQYRAPLPVGEAVRELRDGSGSQFDPDCVQVFLSLVRGLAELVPKTASGRSA